ncbi:MAG: hypothetical protein CVV47_08680 [Spirochaetae bacterium HGW-Spirochaetae-3]|jgi:hypothetical protein|nr:MAG: hypothetical protein CVV47_08680 [Spirochaetae bacterium HGW-Spirochaetae-3]
MDEDTLKKLSDDIADIKRAVKRNDPLLHDVAAPPGWAAFSLVAGIILTLFALPAHILTTRYGSFDAIPTGAKTALWAVLALFLIGGGVSKVLLMTRKAARVDGRDGLAKVVDAFYGGRQAHVTIPLTVGFVAAAAYAFFVGEPWIALPVTSFLIGVIANGVAIRCGLRSYYVIGYWGILMGLVSAPFVEAAPFLWLLIIYGGMLFVFALAQFAETRATGKGDDDRAPGR